ncbi:MAG: transcription elongation factor GreA [Ignavibacteriaceae bacterium]|nr:transcription elongation factor GreA [Ignavibacteriaceae bacterium]NUM71638.1 transcription elongation factor GreA [Ignavibacteriaceae bacterium]
MSDSGVVYLSKERLIELEKELLEMKTNGRKEIAQKIADARSHGDLSENAEYDAAKEEQGHFEMKLSKIEGILARARVVDPAQLPKDKVHILAKVTMKNHRSGKVIKYQLVSAEEADLEQGKVSIVSPLGQALMGKPLGELVKVKAPAGIIDYEILGIE